MTTEEQWLLILAFAGIYKNHHHLAWNVLHLGIRCYNISFILNATEFKFLDLVEQTNPQWRQLASYDLKSKFNTDRSIRICLCLNWRPTRPPFHSVEKHECCDDSALTAVARKIFEGTPTRISCRELSSSPNRLSYVSNQWSVPAAKHTDFTQYRTCPTVNQFASRFGA